MLSLRPDSSFEERLSTWLTEDLGVSEFRRVVRVTAGEVLLSKFEEGFAARVHATIARLPELFEDAAVEASYASVVRARAESTRVFCWHEAARNVVSGAVADGRISADEAAEVLAGVDSVAALMDSVLWTAPTAAGPYTPGPGECDAYREALAKMAAEPGLFTRFYGSFEGRRVVNHCPGATFGRRLFEQAWRICTGVPPPSN